MKIYLYIAALMAAIGILPLDGPYYEMLRLVLSGAGIAILVKAYSRKSTAWAVTGGAIFVLWFPVFGVYLDKGTWVFLDVVVAITLILFSRSAVIVDDKPSGADETP